MLHFATPNFYLDLGDNMQANYVQLLRSPGGADPGPVVADGIFLEPVMAEGEILVDETGDIVMAAIAYSILINDGGVVAIIPSGD